MTSRNETRSESHVTQKMHRELTRARRSRRSTTRPQLDEIRAKSRRSASESTQLRVPNIPEDSQSFERIDMKSERNGS